LIYWPPNAGTPASNNFQFGLGNPSQPIEFTDPPQNALMLLKRLPIQFNGIDQVE
jgi:hypothetical protein